MGWDSELYERCLRFAATWHSGQNLPEADIPYVVHLAQVTQRTLRGLSEDGAEAALLNLAMQAAILHDVLEDTSCSYADVVQHFGQ